MNSSIPPDQKNLIHECLEMLSTYRTEQSPRVHETDWDYVESGADWYKVCSQGAMQSPIMIDPVNTIRISSVGMPYYPFTFHYPPVTSQGYFSEKTFQIPFNEGELEIYTMSGNVRKFNTTRIEFHAPAEHIVKGKQKALEVHIVHKEQVTGNLLILAILFKLAASHNTFIQEVLGGEEFDLAQVIGLKPCLNVYFGSLTFPPCSETVLWLVSNQVQKLSFEQIKFFSSKWENNQAFARGHGNNRATQSLGNRVILNFS
jgi:carbonic anhydrase